jgi:hypothetical protein
VVVDHTTLTVGPLVLPGRSPCLACVDAVRPASRPLTSAAVPLEARVLGAAVTTVTVLSALRGQRDLAGISTEISLDRMAVIHRVWRARYGCGCTSARMAG